MVSHARRLDVGRAHRLGVMALLGLALALAGGASRFDEDQQVVARMAAIAALAASLWPLEVETLRLRWRMIAFTGCVWLLLLLQLVPLPPALWALLPGRDVYAEIAREAGPAAWRPLSLTPDLTLEYGDRVGVLMPPDRKEEVRRYFGDTVKAAAEFSYVSLGLGMVMGVLLGLIPIPIPGVGTVTLGIGGGPLIVALIVGRLRRTGPISWVMPLPANIVLRNFGLTLFLATVGLNSGQAFVTTVSQTGPLMLLIGAAVLLTTVLMVLLVGYYLLKVPYDDLVGVASGATGNPAILVYSTRMAPTERPDIGYAMIFPSMTIVKVIAVQIVGLLVGAS